jgi:hypothetical protein
MSDFPAGKRKQFHFYAWPFMDAQGASVTARVPRYTMPGGLDDAENMFVGEIGSGSHGNAWPELNGADVNDTRDRVFERLKLVARRGYPLALVWGNEGWSWPPNTPPVDTWEFTPDAILGVTDFTFGLFPDGVP